MQPNHARLAIQTVTQSGFAARPAVDAWLEQVFPEYAPPCFAERLARLNPPGRPPQMELLIVRVDGCVAGVVQMLYTPWRGGLLADVDLLGVLAPYRRLGLGTALFTRALEAARRMAAGSYVLPALGVVTLIDPNDPAILGLHARLGGQVRRDLPYYSGDVLVWYPFAAALADAPTADLLESMRLFGKLLFP